MLILSNMWDDQSDQEATEDVELSLHSGPAALHLFLSTQVARGNGNHFG